MEYHWIRTGQGDIERLRKATDGVALLTLASIEAHGPHLPVGSDTLCIEYVIEQVLQQEPVAVLPVLGYANAPTARMLPGTINIPTEILQDFVECICDEVCRNGFRKIALLHAHGGNLGLGKAFAYRILEREKPYTVYSIPVLAGKGDEVSRMLETTEWGHACEFETSLNMAACPDLVHLEKLGDKTFPSEKGPDVGCVSTPVDWIAPHPEMVVGEPGKAAPDKGERFARLWAEGIVGCLRKIKSDGVSLPVMESYGAKVHAVGRQGTVDDEHA